jgi:hypothetical protein
MTSSFRMACGIVCIFFIGSTARGFDGIVQVWPAPPTTVRYYSFPVPVYQYSFVSPYYYYYCPPAPRLPVRVVPVDGSQSIFADPVPAPPSPPQKKAVMSPAKSSSSPAAKELPPKIIATRSVENAVPGVSVVPKDRCRVGFWNVTGRDVTLTIEGKSWKVPKDQSITLDLEWTFSWQIDQRPQQIERIPTGQNTHELVIRD